jgi:hypothetical protein
MAQALGFGAVGVISTSDIQLFKRRKLFRLQEKHQESGDQGIQSGRRHRIMGETARQQAGRLRDEMTRRRLRYSPIEW